MATFVSQGLNGQTYISAGYSFAVQPLQIGPGVFFYTLMRQSQIVLSSSFETTPITLTSDFLQ